MSVGGKRASAAKPKAAGEGPIEKALARRPAAAEAIERMLDGLTADVLADEISRTVIGQERAVRDACLFTVSKLKCIASLCRGVPEDELPQLNTFLIDGNSGCGKTFIARQLCKRLGLGMYSIDGSSLTGSGWKGASLQDHLYHVAEEQERGTDGPATVVFIDEVDKLSIDEEHPSFSPIKDFLRVIEGSDAVVVEPRSSGSGTLAVDKGRIIFVLAGAFEGLDRCVADRIRRSSGGSGLGFTASSEVVEAFSAGSAKLRAEAIPEDLVGWGWPIELVGRVTAMTRVNPLGVESMKRIIRGADGSAESRFGMLMPLGCLYSVDDSAVELIAEEAAKRGVGARGIESALNGPSLAAADVARRDGSIVSVRIVARDGEVVAEYEHGERELGAAEDPMLCEEPELEPEAGAGEAFPAAPTPHTAGPEGPAACEAVAGEPPSAEWGDKVTGVMHDTFELRLAADGGPDPLGACLRSGRLGETAGAIVDIALRGMDPARALVASELILGCCYFICNVEVWNADIGGLIGLVEEEARGELRDRVLDLYAGRGEFDRGELGGKEWGRRTGTGIPRAYTSIKHRGTLPDEEPALQRLLIYWGLAGSESSPIAAETAEALRALVPSDEGAHRDTAE